MNFKIQNFNSHTILPYAERKKLAAFLNEHLENFGDPENDILKAIDFALGENGTPGGSVIICEDSGEICGAVVINNTGMSGYIPENILVYIATHKSYRGKGLGRKMMESAIDTTEGGIALHVEPDNPAIHLYTNMGFTHKYLEMRLNK